jgi:hypothetical protein
MNLLRGLAAVAALSVLGIGSAQATVVTETYESTITNSNISAVSVDETFTWTVTYDDASLRMHKYSDGANHVAEGGGGDDTLTATGCTFNVASSTHFSDAQFDVSAFYDVMAAAGFTGYDYYDANNSWAYQDGQVPSYWFTVQNDDFYFLANDNPNQIGKFETKYSYGQLGGYRTAQLSFTSIRFTAPTSSVPEPASFALLGTGLIGMAISRKRKHKTLGETVL